MALENWIILFALFGAADAIYTALHQKFLNMFEFCFDSKLKRVGCREILHGKYSRIFVVPNSWLGIVVYFLIAAIYYYNGIFFIVQGVRLEYAGLLISFIGLAFSAYLLGVQKFKLKKYCIFCLFSSLMMTVITTLALVIVLAD